MQIDELASSLAQLILPILGEETNEAYKEPNEPPSMVNLWRNQPWGWLEVRTSSLSAANQESKLMGAFRQLQFLREQGE